jgi:hypothetical protein
VRRLPVAGKGGISKLRQAILYVAWATKDDPKFGSTKLNKTLFRADFRSYFYRGEPITGYSYQALKDGPTLVAMVPALRDMQRDGLVRLDKPPAGQKGEHRVVPLRESDFSELTPEDRAELDAAIARLQPMSAEEASKLSHKFPGWKLAWDEGRGDRTRIPMESVFLDDDDEPIQEWEEEQAGVAAQRARLLQ